ncbi:putative peroxidase [Medicago truncatula]|nr:peroxidase family protein [Medicago truncatula]RHN56715.1 putative peroxidase [Medicago truncatula]
MASSSPCQIFLVFVMVTLVTSLIPSNALLTPHFYDNVCPQALPTIKSVVLHAILREKRIGASLLRLHFHDCFVNGCDGSVLLDDTPNFTGEKTALPNINSIRGFSVVDEIKAAVDKVCKGPVVSCADILATAARDSVAILGGPQFFYNVLLGRRDARTASKAAANANLPSPTFNFSQLISNFKSQASLRKTCPRNGGDNNLTPLDFTPTRVENTYYRDLLYKRGVLHSDQQLFKGQGSESDKLVQLYSKNTFAFASDFKTSLIKMGNIKPLTGRQGEIRLNCRRVR